MYRAIDLEVDYMQQEVLEAPCRTRCRALRLNIARCCRGSSQRAFLKATHIDIQVDTMKLRQHFLEILSKVRNRFISASLQKCPLRTGVIWVWCQREILHRLRVYGDFSASRISQVSGNCSSFRRNLDSFILLKGKPSDVFVSATQ